MRRLIVVIAAIILVTLVAGAAFMGGRLLWSQPQAGSSGSLMMPAGGSIAPAKAISLKIEPAPELPTTPDTISGLFVRREDNSFFVGTGKVQLSMMIGKNGQQPAVNADYDGPVVEVVVTRDTQIYRDKTPVFFSEGDLSQETHLQQVVELVDSPEGIGEHSMLRVWGEQRGDRVIADVLFYQSLSGN